MISTKTQKKYVGIIVWAAMVLAGCYSYGTGGTESVCLSSCDDGNPCTEDRCHQDHGCIFIKMDGDTCDDGDPCTTQSMCRTGVCVGDKRSLCNDDNPCTLDTCVSGVGCLHVQRRVGHVCDDLDACTIGDMCQTDGACVGRPLVCNDGNMCTMDVCRHGVCIHPPLDCDDGDQCTRDVCDPVQGCRHKMMVRGPCNDDNPCTKDRCVANTCTYEPWPEREGRLCDDGNMCTRGDRCLLGLCTGVQHSTCDVLDGASLCDPQTGQCIPVQEFSWE